MGLRFQQFGLKIGAVGPTFPLSEDFLFMSGSGTGSYFEFNPELVIEVTMVCDRACPGCYAPNLITRDEPGVVLRKHRGLFLKPEALRGRLSEITSSINRQLTSLSFRGGEPTRHPELPALVDASLRFTRRLYVESHARWALPGRDDTAVDINAVMKALTRRNVVLKVSFDSMHETSAAQLKVLLERLDRRHVNWLVAITEPDDERFAAQRMLCDWVPNSKIVRHQKAAHSSELYTPPLGVIRPDGSLLRHLSTRRAF